MAEMTGEQRWWDLFTVQAARLLGELKETDDGWLWTQDLYGRQLRYLGPVHGHAGNMIALMRGWELLTDDQRARERPDAQAWKLALRNCEQRGANPAALRRRQHVELINPPFTKCNDADQLLVVEIAPGLTGREHALSEEPPIWRKARRPSRANVFQ